ncbi:MAG: tRNA (guanosine(46)-N7)-methyltransferase TrmB [Clostridiales bacterium]|jgi:tRNA (guanine-N7-)-methyltransferase|nr:tRNA (guanosine(46)-N7)-methyltransferase TrmB [Clostridiales bacterium]
MRNRKKKWTSKELDTNPLVVHEPVSLKGQWCSHFGNSNPIRLEIGCGKGQFISQAAEKHPEINFVALERDATILGMAARKGNAVTGDKHLAYIVEDVENLPNLFAPGEIEALYIQFCDPWPGKKNRAKRRLTHARFLESYKSLGIGALYFKTDNRELFDFSIGQFESTGWVLENVSYDLHGSGTPANEIMTEYETKFSSLGQPIYRLEAYLGACDRRDPFGVKAEPGDRNEPLGVKAEPGDREEPLGD